MPRPRSSAARCSSRARVGSRRRRVIDADGNFVSFTVVSLSGQNPNLTGEPDCSVVGPYLAGA